MQLNVLLPSRRAFGIDGDKKKRKKNHFCSELGPDAKWYRFLHSVVLFIKREHSQGSERNMRLFKNKQRLPWKEQAQW